MSKQDPTDGLPSYIDLEMVEVYDIHRRENGDISYFKSKPRAVITNEGIQTFGYISESAIYNESETEEIVGRVVQNFLHGVGECSRMILNNFGLSDRSGNAAMPYMKLARMAYWLPPWRWFWVRMGKRAMLKAAR